MREDLNRKLDKITAEELDPAMKNVTDVSTPDGISKEKIKEKVMSSMGHTAKVTKPARVRFIQTKRFAAAIAACLTLCVLCTALLLSGVFEKNTPPAVGPENVAQTDDTSPAIGTDGHAHADDTVKRFTLGVGSGIEFEIAEDRTVKSVKMLDSEDADSIDFTSMKGQDVSTSLRGVLELCEEKGCFAQEDAVQLTFEKEFSAADSEKNDIVETAEIFFYEKGMNPTIYVGQIFEDSDDPDFAEHIGLGNAKQIIADDLGCPSGMSNTLAELILDENGATLYHLYVECDEMNYDYKLDAVTGEIVEKREDPKESPVIIEEPIYSDITAEIAVRIALDEAGVPLDTPYTVNEENGGFIVELQADGWILGYRIRISDGQILEYTKRQEETPEEPPVIIEEPIYSDITAEIAVQIALDDAGEPLDTPCTVNEENGEFIVEFQMNGVTLRYHIRISDGQILEYTKLR